MSLPAADPFARQRLVEGWRQEALADATVVVAGVGALGNEVAKNLALAGVGRLVLCDPDVVEVTNLSRTVLFTLDDVGRPKVDAVRDALATVSPSVSVDVRRATIITGVGLGDLADADVVVGCLDSLHARLELLGRAALVDAPLVDGGTGPWSGEVRVRTDSALGCYACVLAPYERGVTDIPRSCEELEPGSPLPASIATTALVAAWTSIAALRMIMGLRVPYQALRVDGVAGTTAPVAFPRATDCPFHHPLPPVDDWLPITRDDLVSTLLASLQVPCEVTAWAAFPVAPYCLRCGGRTGYDQSHSIGEVTLCAHCGALVRPRRGVDLATADPSASLGSLGVAPHEILRMRTAEGQERWLRLAG